MSDSVKIHKMIDDATSDRLRIIADSIGLGVINYELPYRMYKIGTKLHDESIESIRKQLKATGVAQIVGSASKACLYISNVSEWFKTSPVISCKKMEKSILIETENSFYELVEDV